MAGGGFATRTGVDVGAVVGGDREEVSGDEEETSKARTKGRDADVDCEVC